MFDTLASQPNDPLLALIGLYNSDKRADKIDLGVGVYRDDQGRTPVLKAVKEAEKQLLATQESKSYVAPEGDRQFLDLLWHLVEGGQTGRFAAGVQTPGGSGALRLASDLLARAGARRLLLGVPTWPNHPGIFGATGLNVETYPFFDVPTQSIRFAGMIKALSGAQKGDAVLLHASCHNPTGAPLSAAQWDDLAAVIAERKLIPLIDSAYQGFGEGIEEDVYGLRKVLRAADEALVAVSCSKSFGIYRERTGAIFAVAGDARTAEIARSNLVTMARTSYSMPPDHGAAVVRTILSSEELRRVWMEELDSMRNRLNGLRRELSAALADSWQLAPQIDEQEGMFSLLPLDQADVLKLREEHGLYMPTSGRINIAGLKSADIGRVAEILKPLLR
ncbi:aspartate/tyrosine/aromatic aminotransferase (plasmid) [Peteryoungia desertarenae]|uniref:Aspartate/tyrosine/aromatic aminotransferase n=1 Tax=Peteryoungia desertarenae TaxID=1813451 RepID=A0ABX6QTN2_9HYPH|nr:amino acid aminotransferase [Peteryoungia desertarenae]QLF71565.1 aspartate/tyrosine/aromatic aminotransferase [Peteryoungia desertarenae]